MEVTTKSAIAPLGSPRRLLTTKPGRFTMIRLMPFPDVRRHELKKGSSAPPALSG